MKNDKQERILDAMEELMCCMPDKDISVNLIAEKAGIAKGSVYYYFKSKEDILNAVVSRCYKKAIHEFFNGIQTESSALEKIKLLFRSLIKKEFRNKEQNLILTLHLHEDLQLHNKMKMVAVQEIAPILTALLQEGCAGRFHPDGHAERKRRNDCRGPSHFFSITRFSQRMMPACIKS